MIPLYKGFGLRAEREVFEQARRTTAIAHRLDMRVGCYTFSGSAFYESLLLEEPEAHEWFIRDHNDQYSLYEGRHYHRRWVNRDHPGVRAHMKELVRIAVQDVKVDLIHFDNYFVSPAYEPYSDGRFREYLKRKYTPEQLYLRFGVRDPKYIEAPVPPNQFSDITLAEWQDRIGRDSLTRDFINYRVETQADTYRELSEYARSLNPEVVMEFNGHGYYGRLTKDRSAPVGGLDHTLLLPWGGAMWDEGYPSTAMPEGIRSRFRSHRLARHFDSMVFQYTPHRSAMAESMANGLQVLGCPVWFQGGVIRPMVALRNPTQIDSRLRSYIDFFHKRQDLLRDAVDASEVAVLQPYESVAFSTNVERSRATALEQALYQSHVPFTILPGRYPGDLSRYRVLVMPEAALVSDTLAAAVRHYVLAGGGLLITGRAGAFNEDYEQRSENAFAALFHAPLGKAPLRARPGKGRAAYLPTVALPPDYKLNMLPLNSLEIVEAARWAAGTAFHHEVEASESVGTAVYRQPGRSIIHLVNYREEEPVPGASIRLDGPLPTRVRLLSPDGNRDEVLKPALEQGRVEVRIPRFEVYAVIVVERE